MSYIYEPLIASKAVSELNAALYQLFNEEYAIALLSDPRMTSTKGLLASCGLTYGEIKFVRQSVPDNIPTLSAQKKARAFLDRIDEEQKKYGYSIRKFTR